MGTTTDSTMDLDRSQAWWATVLHQANWKAPGPDGIPAYWLKAFPTTTEAVMIECWKVADGESECPGWLIHGRTVMIPKEGCTGELEQFRPITCLNTTYKLLTGAASRVLMHHADRFQLLPEEQKAMRKGRRGCLDALAIDLAVSKERKDKEKDMLVAWLDFRKAYDLVPHRVILETVKSCKAPRWIQSLLRTVMPEWKTTIIAWSEVDNRVTIPIHFSRGLFQGDALSPLLFCLCAAPLSLALRETRGVGSEFQAARLTHLMFMDDLKVYSESALELQESVRKVEEITVALGMELGLRKCATVHMSKQGRGDLTLNSGAEILELDDQSSYRYLGIQQLIRTVMAKTREEITAKYLERTRLVWRSNLDAGSKARAHNMWAVSLLRYFLHAAVGNRSVMRGLDRKTRAVLREFGAHEAVASVERLYLHRNEYGRGLNNLLHEWESAMISKITYFTKLRSHDQGGT